MRRLLGYTAGTVKYETRSAFGVGMVNANLTIERLARLAYRWNLGNTIGAVKVHALEAFRDILLRNTSGPVEDEAGLARRTIGGNTVHAVEGTSGGAFWRHSRRAVVLVAIGTGLADREIRKFAVFADKR
jgi:hypothetical protein